MGSTSKPVVPRKKCEWCRRNIVDDGRVVEHAGKRRLLHARCVGSFKSFMGID
jgi:hypothetical protein